MKVKSLCKIRPVPTILLIACLFLWHSAAYGQNCTGGTPSFSVNLSGQPGGTWVSPAAQRAGTCCGVSNNCVEFSILLDSAAVGINFSVASGADPGGALAYQINCGPVYYTGTPICLNGPGPHIITFCKPGNNINTYQITSIPGPQVSPPIIVNDGCTGVLSVSSLEPATVTWTSVYPGPPGAYNSYASCLSGCLSTTITGQTNPPPYVDYQVCGTVVGSCGQANYCDTVRAYFNPTLAVNIVPQNPTVCFGDAGVTITATGSGGQPPYTYTWSNGATTQSVFVGPGTYTVTMQDNSNCPPVSDTVQVTEFLLPILADAGPDQYLCRQSPQASLSGSVQAASGLQWSSSGGGTFAPSNTVLNPVYTPSPAELSAGTAMLIAQTTGNGTCPPDLDTVMIYYGSFQALLNPAIQPVSCFGLSDGSINVSISGANAPYTFSWFNGSAASGVSGLAAGTYNLTVTDRYGCDSTFSFIVTEPPLLTVSASVTSDYNGQNISCNGASDGSAAALATGGTAPYAYTWSSGPAQASATGLSAGTYTVQVTDANGCTATTTVTLTEPPLLTISASVTSNYNGQDVSCNGASDGSAGSLASGGTAPYAYTWSSGSAQASATGLSAGTYTVQVTDANGCTASTTVTLTEPPLLTISASVTSNYNGQDVSCNGASDGSAGSLASGGTAPYVYAWSSGSAQASATGLAAGTYTVQVTDANGCTASTTVTLTEPPLLTISASVTSNYNGQDISCNGASDGSAGSQASGGTAPYVYAWSSGSAQASATGLSAGTYTVQVTDANGCTATTTVTLTEPPLLTISASVTSNYNGQDVSCNGASDGSAGSLASGGTAPYVYAWSSGSAQASATGLSAGTYTVQVTDANGCTATTTVTLTEPPLLTVSASVTSNYNGQDVSCNGASDGSAGSLASGGTAPYVYAWSSGSTQASATGLAAGTYTVQVTDANGCTASTAVTLTEPPLLTISASVTSNYNGQDVSCNGASDGSAGSLVTGGTAPYAYAWSSGSAQASATGLSAGTYTVQVTDANGCTASATVTLTEPPQLAVSAFVTSDYNGQDVSCNGSSDGSAAAIATGGTAPYAYAWSSGTTQALATGLSAGTYTVQVTDANGCTVSTSVTLTEPTPLLAIPNTLNNVSCNGGSDGVVFAAPQGGVGPYTFLWNTGFAGDTLTSLPVGVYTVQVTDANNCTASANVSVLEPSALALQITNISHVHCMGGNNGSATAAASGGVAPYTYSWSNGASGSTANGLTAGTYTVTATDANGCTLSAQAQVLEPGLLMANVDSLRDVTCYGYANGYAQASASGGTSPYTFSWSSGASTTSIGNLSGGTYTVSVLDMNGCAAFASATIEEPGPLGASAGLADGISCSGAADGVIMVSAQGGTPSYTYNWSNGANTAAVSNVAPGTYTVLVSDSNGCQVSDVITVTEPAPLQLTLQPEDVSCYGYADGQIESTVTGGTPAYTYSWSNGSSTPGYSGVAGTYTLTVTDANGCVISATGSVAEPPPLNVVLDLYMEVYAGDSVYLSPQVSGGSGSYLYEWTPGETVTCSTCLSTYAWPERNTRYEILVTDANGCTAEADALIEIINTFFIPNTFTPDGDGFNEVFAASSTKVKDFEMYIFDRWGEVVFHSTDIGTGWDGFFRGSPAKQDVYVYKINVRFDNNKSEQLFGHVNLLR